MHRRFAEFDAQPQRERRMVLGVRLDADSRDVVDRPRGVPLKGVFGLGRSAEPASSSCGPDEIGVAQPLPLHPPDDRGHLVDGVEATDAGPAAELVEVTLEMLRAHVVVDPDVGALDDRPKALDAGDEYNYYPRYGDELVFGAQGINLSDAANFVVEESGIDILLSAG